MDRLRAKELLPIITAFVNGDEIQVLHPRFSAAAGDTERWASTDDITGKGEYRIKTKPREVWLEIAIKNGEVLGFTDKCDGLRQNPITRFHLFREVEDET